MNRAIGDAVETFRDGLGFAAFVWPVTTVLGLWAIVMCHRASVGDGTEAARHLRRCVWPLVGIPVILVLTGFFGRVGPMPRWPQLLSFGVLALQITAALVLWIRGREARRVLAAVFALEIWLSVCMTFASAMLISGDGF